jgi:3-deoxy-D-manno-octulosonic-acid transferase
MVKRRIHCLKEDPHHYKERFGAPTLPRPKGSLVWVHAASVGETRAALSWIQAQDNDYATTYLLTTVTLTGHDTCKASSSGDNSIIHQFAPFDIPRWIEAFLNHWDPQEVILMESEIWPNWLKACKKRHIPVHLKNARMSSRSLKKWKTFPRVAQYIFQHFQSIEAQSHDMVTFFKDIGCTNVSYVRNLKLSAPPLPVCEEKRHILQNMIKDRPVWLAASTHKGEEEIVFNVHKNLLKKIPHLLLILIPRHPERCHEIASLYVREKMAIRSKNDIIYPQTHVYLADTLGELGLFYSLCSVGFLGGSFVAVGGHNPIEAHQLNCHIFSGPYVENFNAIMKELEVPIVKNDKELEEKIRHFF